MVAHKLYGMLIACIIVVGTVKSSSTWRDTLNITNLRNYLAALYTGNAGTQEAAANRLERTNYDACIDFIADFLNSNLGQFSPDEQVTLLKFKKLMVQKLSQHEEAKRTALLHDIDTKIAILKKK